MLLPLSVVWKNPRHITFLFARPFIIGMKESQFIQVHPSTGLSDNSQEVKHRYGHAAGIQTMDALSYSEEHSACMAQKET